MCVYRRCGCFSGQGGGGTTDLRRSVGGICGIMSWEMQNQGLMPFSTSQGALEQVPSKATTSMVGGVVPGTSTTGTRATSS